MSREALLAALRAKTRAEPLPVQIRPPDPEFKGWLALGGRGSGKTFAMIQYLIDEALINPKLRARIIGPTLGDVVSSCVEGPSGVLANDSTAVFRPGAPGGSLISWPSGAVCRLIGTPTMSEVDRLRATGNVELDLFEELAANRMQNAVWEQAALGRRIGNPRWVAATTPRPTPLIKSLAKDKRYHVTRGTSHTNPYLPDEFREELDERLKGTRIYRQEVLGEIIDDVEGALWTQTDIDRGKVHPEDRDALMSRIVKLAVGVDPPAESGTCGIVVVGMTMDEHVYVLDDYSVTDVSAGQWARSVAQAVEDYPGALVVAETNMGGRMVPEVLKAADITLPVKTVTASVGKSQRATPVAVLWEADEQQAHLAPEKPTSLLELESQMLEWVPGMFSPDRIDAMVWAVRLLRERGGFRSKTSNPARSGRTVPGRGAMGRSASAIR